MSVQLKKGVLEMCVLGKIVKKDSYGYDVYQDINKSLNISESTIYPILRKLVNEGYCESYLKESNEGPPRKYFKITNLGTKKYLMLRENWEEFTYLVNKIIRSDSCE